MKFFKDVVVTSFSISYEFFLGSSKNMFKKVYEFLQKRFTNILHEVPRISSRMFCGHLQGCCVNVFKEVVRTSGNYTKFYENLQRNSLNFFNEIFNTLAEMCETKEGHGTSRQPNQI